MRTALTLVRPHGEDNFGTVSGPEVSVPEQVAGFKALQSAGKEHAEIAEAQLWISDCGITKRIRFAEPKPAEPAEPAEGDAPKPKRARKS